MPGRILTPRPLVWALGIPAAGLLIMLGCFLYVQWAYGARIVAANAVPAAPVAIVFGAGLTGQGAPSPMLAARVRTAVGLFQAGKARQVLLSGNSDRHHDEIRAMRKLAQLSGLPESAILVDSEGLSTFDTCARAREVYGANHVILVTQAFHMPRALFVANSLGLDAWGVETNPGALPRASYVIRELFARPLALFLVLTQSRHRPQGRGGTERSAVARPDPGG